MLGPQTASNGVESSFTQFGRPQGSLNEFDVGWRTNDKFIGQNLSRHSIEPRESERRASELLVTQRRRQGEQFRPRPCRQG